MLYIACEDMDFVWRERDVAEVERLWREGYDIRYIAQAVRRNVDEVTVLIMDRVRYGALKRRPTGVFGKTGVEDEDQGEEWAL